MMELPPLHLLFLKADYTSLLFYDNLKSEHFLNHIKQLLSLNANIVSTQENHSKKYYFNMFVTNFLKIYYR